MNAPKLLRLIALAAALAALIGCGKNLPTSVMVPTGYRPGTPPGGILGTIAFDSLVFPGFSGAPYPLTRVELHTYHHDTLGPLVAVQTVGGDGRTFSFEGLMPDSYMVQLRVHPFRPRDYGPIRIELDRFNTGPVFMPAAPESLPAVTFVIGTMPGFSPDEAFSTFASSMVQAPLGVWNYPDELFGYIPIAAGTYRFKFVTDFSSTPTRLIGWGGDSTVTLTAPVTNSPARFASGPAEDIKVTIPTSGNWQFIFDERRLTFSITPAPAGPAFAARARTPR